MVTTGGGIKNDQCSTKAEMLQKKFIRWRKVAKENNRVEIDLIQNEMELKHARERGIKGLGKMEASQNFVEWGI